MKTNENGWGAMRQVIDLKRNNTHRIVIFNDVSCVNFCRIGDSSAKIRGETSRSSVFPGAMSWSLFEGQSVALTQHVGTAVACLLESIFSGSMPVSARHWKVSVRAVWSRSTAFPIEGVFNLGRSFAACIPAINESEQRCCAAA